MSKLFGALIKNKKYAGTIIVEKYVKYSIEYKWNYSKQVQTANLPDYSLACIFELSDDLYDKYKEILGIDRRENKIQILTSQDDIKFLLGVLDANGAIIYKNKQQFNTVMGYED